MNIFKLSGAAVIASALLLGSVQQVQAIPTPINGTIAFAGVATVGVAGPTTTITPASPWLVLGGTIDYLGTAGALATMAPIAFTTATEVLTGPVIPAWTFTIGPVTYSFDLLTLASAEYLVGPGGLINSAALSGTGIAHITGYLDTIATWALSGSGPTPTLTFAFETTTATGAPVPDGGVTAMLLGIAFLGVAGLRRKVS